MYFKTNILLNKLSLNIGSYPWKVVHTKLLRKTRMTTFTKTKFKKSDDQTNIDKSRVAANITEYHNIWKLIFLKIVIKIHEDKAIIM